jgi:hypothetical protein
MDGSRQLFALMNNAFLGFVLSAAYGVATAGAVWGLVSAAEFQRYQEAFFVTFNCAISGGLVMTTAILVLQSQTYVLKIIEKTFSPNELSKTSYSVQKTKYISIVRSLTFASSFAIAACGIFYLARFPFRGWSEMFLVLFGSVQYALGVYVGRKLFYIAQMLRAIEGIPIRKDIFQNDKLGGIPIYVNAVSTLTVILVFVAIYTYYYAPFEYSSLAGSSVRVLMLLPGIIALPVLALFNYYPRTVVRRLYQQSIAHSLRGIRRKLKDQALSEYERHWYVIEYDKISRDELRYRLRMTLSDLPMAVTLALALLSLMMAR